jgi:uncharacterized protein (DUF2237 family)
VTPEEFHQIAELIGGLSSDMQSGFEEMRAEFTRVHAEFTSVKGRLDLIEARMDRHGGLLQSGSRWVNRLNQWSEKMDHMMAAREQVQRDHESRIERLEHPDA